MRLNSFQSPFLRRLFHAASAPVIAPVNGTELDMYCTLPLGVGLPTQPGQLCPRVDWKQFQTSPKLRLILLDANGVPINITGALSVTLRLAPQYGGLLLAEAMTIEYAAGGQVSYVFQADDVATALTFNLDVECVMADGSLMYFPSDGYVVFQIHASLGM